MQKVPIALLLASLFLCALLVLESFVWAQVSLHHVNSKFKKPDFAKKECPPVLCKMACRHGFKVSEKTGCPVCACKKPTNFACPQVACMLHCPNGYKMTKTGCPTCVCKDGREEDKPTPKPTPIRCGTPPHGSVNPNVLTPEQQETTTTNDNQNVLLKQACKRKCKKIAGLARVVNGQCECIPRSQLIRPKCKRCYRFCPSGYKPSHGICPSCQCKKRVEQEMELTWQHFGGWVGYKFGAQVACPKMNCDTSHCEFGVRKFFGCETCACAKRPSTYAELLKPLTSPSAVTATAEHTLSDDVFDEFLEEVL
ncbi:hypothetical protein C9374_003472 [Naegleria lovaniensis]|uniref:Antistasin-like domain-containing protein n=1 Tax=Naegleria lovaniensis TaxID=51637 RepID=A0AA88GMY9_NAELO|nr:uncharacterized protein C9374_003472 [Naegleria lovaniensis]KAG2385657.1 hypothetical protein C9374_003472 [Naegleria lovaniensis]